MTRMLTGDTPSRLAIWRARWAGMEPTTRLVVLGLLALLATTGVGLALVWSRPDMRPVVSGVDAREADAVVGKLEEMKISYRLDEGGRTVLVSAADLYRARLELAGSGVTAQGRPGFELFDKVNLHSSDFAERVNYVRAISGELEATIRSIPSVKATRVHLSMPREAVFLDDQVAPTASVLLELQPGAVLTASQARGIRNLVASSVEGLKPEDVTVMDTSGRLLLSQEETGSQLDGDEDQLARSLQRTAQQVLDGVLGPGRALASVRVEVVRDRREVRRDVVEPGRERTRNDTREAYQGTMPSPTPSPGVGGPPVRDLAPGQRPQYDQRSTQVDYELSHRTESVQESPSKIRRLTASVLVDTQARLAPDAQAALADAIKLAVGFDEARGDRFDLRTVPFNRSQLDAERQAMEAAEKQAAQERSFMAAVGAAGAAVLGLCGLAAMLLSGRRRRQPAAQLRSVEQELQPASLPGTAPLSLPAEAPVAALSAPQFDVLLPEARRAATEQPAVAARLISLWVGDDHPVSK